MKSKQLKIHRLLALTVILVFIIYFNLFIFAPRLIPAFLRLGIPRQPLNIIIIGSDINYDRVTGLPMPDLKARADSLIFVHLDPIRSRLNIVSIPRDSYVNIPTIGMSKINAANALGGVALTKQTVEKLMSKKIDYYLLVKPSLIPKVVDALGGVNIDVEKDMFYTDKAQHLYINLKMGYQKLNGSQAHQYIRFRHDLLGDISRVERQQIFLRALSQAMARPSNIIKAPYILNSILSNIETDIPVNQAVRIINFMRMGKQQAVTLYGTPATVPYAGSVWLIDQASLEAVTKEMF